MTSQLHTDRTQTSAAGPRDGGRRPSFRVLAAIALGGALGASARAALAQLVPVEPGSFPLATLIVNVTGSFLLGAVLVLLLERFPPSRYRRPLVATGFLGAYTTYSTFAVETVMLVRDGHLTTALAYVAASLVAGLGVVWVGMSLGRALPLPPAAGGTS